MTEGIDYAVRAARLRATAAAHTNGNVGESLLDLYHLYMSDAPPIVKAEVLATVLLGPDRLVDDSHPLMLELLARLALAYRETGRRAEATLIYQRIMKLRPVHGWPPEVAQLLEKARYEPSLSVAKKLLQEANEQSSVGVQDPTISVHLLEQAVLLRETLSKLDDGDTASVYHRLAIYLDRIGERKQSVQGYRRYIDRLLATESRDHSTTSVILMKYGMFLRDVDFPQEADATEWKVEKERLHELRAELQHDKDKGMLRGLAATRVTKQLFRLGRIEEAVANEEAMLLKLLADLPPDDITIHVALDSFSQLLRAQKLSTQADAIEALRQFRKTDGRDLEHCAVHLAAFPRLFKALGCWPPLTASTPMIPVVSPRAIADARWPIDLEEEKRQIATFRTRLPADLLAQVETAERQSGAKAITDLRKLIREDLAPTIRAFLLWRILDLQATLVPRNLVTEAQFLDDIAHHYTFMGDERVAYEALRKSAHLLVQGAAFDESLFIEVLQSLARIAKRSRMQTAVRRFVDYVLAEQRKTLSNDHPAMKAVTAVRDSSLLDDQESKLAALEQAIRSLVATREGLADAFVGGTNLSQQFTDFRNGLEASSNPADGLPLIREVLVQQQATLEKGHPAIAVTAYSGAVLARASGRDEEADTLLALAFETLGSPLSATSIIRLELEYVKRWADRLARISREADQLAATRRDLQELSQDQNNQLVQLLFEAQRFEEAAEIHRRLVESSQEVERQWLLKVYAGRHQSACQMSHRLSPSDKVFQRLRQCLAVAWDMHQAALVSAFADVERRLQEVTDEQARLQLRHSIRSSLQHAIQGAYDLAAASPEKKDEVIATAIQLAEWGRATPAGEALQRLAFRHLAGNAEGQELIRAAEDASRRAILAERFWLDAVLLGSDTTKIIQLAQQVSTERIRATQQKDRLPMETKSAIQFDLETIRKGLQPSEAIVSFLVLPPEVYAWVIRTEGVVQQRLQLDLDEVRTSAQSLHARLQPQRGLEPVPVAKAYQLWRVLFEPLAIHLQGISRLRIIPDGLIASLPFAVLVVEPPEKEEWSPQDSWRPTWFIERFSFSVVPSLQAYWILTNVVRPSNASKPMIGFGDPVLEGPPGPGTQPLSMDRLYINGRINREGLRQLPRLPDTPSELEAIRHQLGALQADLVTGPNFTEHRLRETPLHDYRVLVFATHGLTPIGEVRGVESGLVATPPSSLDDTDDGVLTASEITELRLDADLVILSACNSAIDPTGGEERGLSGLASAFLHAGARSVLVSNWPVVSSIAARLTVPVAEVMRQRPTDEPADALRRAMLKLMRDSNEPYFAHPAMWGPFFLVGH